ncbi:hypothetical protein RFI_26435, partial [Reticulomyxa filosa]
IVSVLIGKKKKRDEISNNSYKYIFFNMFLKNYKWGEKENNGIIKRKKGKKEKVNKKKGRIKKKKVDDKEKVKKKKKKEGKEKKKKIKR